MTRRFGTILLLLALAVFSAGAQGYVVPEIRHSQDKVRVAGKVYWSHVVMDKQTLWSICKAYEVTIEEVYAANPTLNLKSEGLKTGQILMIPYHKPSRNKPAPAVQEPSRVEMPAPEAPGPEAYVPAGSVAAPADSLVTPVHSDSLSFAADSLRVAPDSAEVFVPDIPERIAMSVLIPLGTRFSPAEGPMSFYSGVLLAARDLGNKGIKMDVSLSDISDSLHRRDYPSFLDADVILGPIGEKDIKAALERLPEGKRLVSPLDPRVAALADSSRIVQAPTPWQAQIRDLVAWAAQETQPGDSLVLVKEAEVAMSEASRFLVEELARTGLSFKTISYGILQGLAMQETFENCVSPGGTTRYFIASDNEAFVGDVIRNANLMAYKEHEVTVYCPSKVRSFELIDVETFHNVSLRLSTTYFTDYSDPDVKAFVMAYRALFKTEPDSYAFQGYDTAMYFASICSVYGRNWFLKLPEYSRKGLHTDFRFAPTASKGQVNTAVRRVVYEKDFSVKVQ